MRKAERAKAWKAGSTRSKSGREGCAASVYLDYTYYINILEDAYGC